MARIFTVIAIDVMFFNPLGVKWGWGEEERGRTMNI